TQTYHIYSHRPTKLTSRLALPKFWSSALALDYTLSQDTPWNSDTRSFDDPSITRIQSGSFYTGILPNVGMTLKYQVKTFDRNPDLVHRGANLGMEYSSPQRCWGLRFAWGQPLAEPEMWKGGTYYLGVVVQFLSGTREFGNLLERKNVKPA
ncbi:MAG: hypothetical protein OXT67_01415, partial [Zetaproteobacteria bacterium]|nr:hypothetical protein [Zetaproteobacteria bacterium]